jgi:hypothetical protein
VGAILKILCPRERRVFQSKLGVSSSNQCNLHHSPHTGHLEKKMVQSFSDTVYYESRIDIIGPISTTCSLTVKSRFADGQLAVRSRSNHTPITVQSQFAKVTLSVREDIICLYWNSAVRDLALPWQCYPAGHWPTVDCTVQCIRCSGDILNRFPFPKICMTYEFS